MAEPASTPGPVKRPQMMQLGEVFMPGGTYVTDEGRRQKIGSTNIRAIAADLGEAVTADPSLMSEASVHAEVRAARGTAASMPAAPVPSPVQAAPAPAVVAAPPPDLQSVVIASYEASLPPPPHPFQAFIDNRMRLSMELKDGTFMMTVAEVRNEKTTVFVFFKDDGGSSSFIPKTGTRLTLTWRDASGKEFSRPVFCAGALTTVPALALSIMCFVGNEEPGDGKA